MISLWAGLRHAMFRISRHRLVSRRGAGFQIIMGSFAATLSGGGFETRNQPPSQGLLRGRVQDMRSCASVGAAFDLNLTAIFQDVRSDVRQGVGFKLKA